jgi:hypothetical protein
MSEVLVTQMALEVSQSQQLRQVVSFNLDASKALQLVSQLQLALRYPGNNGPASRLGRQMVDVIKAWFHTRAHLACVTVIERGDDPQFDMQFVFDAETVLARVRGLRESVRVLPALPDDPDQLAKSELKDPITFEQIEQDVLEARGDLITAFDRYERAIERLIELEAS